MGMFILLFLGDEFDIVLAGVLHNVLSRYLVRSENIDLIWGLVRCMYHWWICLCESKVSSVFMLSGGRAVKLGGFKLCCITVGRTDVGDWMGLRGKI